MENSNDYSLSLMDMLCAAMGGVALLVFIFAAMRKNLEQQADRGRVSAFTLIVQYDEKSNSKYRIGKEISFGFFDDSSHDKCCYLGEKPENQLNNSNSFSIVVRSYQQMGQQINFLLVGKLPEKMKMRIWLKDLPKKENSIDDVDIPTKNIKFILFKNSNQIQEGTLTRDSNYINITKSFELSL